MQTSERGKKKKKSKKVKKSQEADTRVSTNEIAIPIVGEGHTCGLLPMGPRYPDSEVPSAGQWFSDHCSGGGETCCCRKRLAPMSPTRRGDVLLPVAAVEDAGSLASFAPLRPAPPTARAPMRADSWPKICELLGARRKRGLRRPFVGDCWPGENHLPRKLERGEPIPPLAVLPRKLVRGDPIPPKLVRGDPIPRKLVRGDPIAAFPRKLTRGEPRPRAGDRCGGEAPAPPAMAAVAAATAVAVSLSLPSSWPRPTSMESRDEWDMRSSEDSDSTVAGKSSSSRVAEAAGPSLSSKEEESSSLDDGS